MNSLLKSEFEDSLALHGCFDLVGRVRKRRREVHQLAVGIDVIDVFDSDSELLLGNVDSGFDGEYHSCRQGATTNIVNVQADKVAESVDEVFSEWHREDLCRGS